MPLSSACVTATVSGKKQTWRFSGVTSVEHVLSLNLNSTAAGGADLVNGARNQPDRITLSVIETDAAGGPGCSARMLEDLGNLKRQRILCRVSTSLGTWKKMLLTEISATRDDENQEGWRGSLVFTQYLPSGGDSASGAKTADNSSVRKNTGVLSARQVAGSAFLQLLRRAGIEI